MQIYHSDLAAIDRLTRNLASVACLHCQRSEHLGSHGYVYKKRHGGMPERVGKRVFCCNRRSHNGCGRTIRLYLAGTIPFLHALAERLSAFVCALVAGLGVADAYWQATGAPARNAWRWLDKLHGRLTTWRSMLHQPPLPEALPAGRRYRHHAVLRATLAALGRPGDGQPLCAAHQLHRQRRFM